MSIGSQKVASIGQIRAQLAHAVKSWNQQTSDLTWPEGDSSMAAMDEHMLTLRAVNARLAEIEKLPTEIQDSLAVHYDETCLQDPGEFERFAAAVEQTQAA